MGNEQNWIPTNPGEGWFSYFRLYGPLEAYLDRSWVLPDIEKAAWKSNHHQDRLEFRLWRC